MWIADMDGEPGRVHVTAAQTPRFLDDVAVDVDFHEIGGTHVPEVHAVLVDQEMMVRAGQTSAEVCIDEIGPAVMRDQTIQCREVATDLPFGLGNAGNRCRGGRDVQGPGIP
jgi:hypothetical protein